MGANVMDGLAIGAHTVIGAGSLVTKSMPSGVIAYGNPCRVVRTNEAQPV
jgi:maltose O-acetyltransferase